MLAALMQFLRILRDRETRSTLQLLSSFVFDQPSWRRKIKTRSARFRCTEEYRVSTYVNSVLDELSGLDVNAAHIRAFEIVCAELISNAFRHGCTGGRGRIRITITFSPWFVRVEAGQSRGGFHLDPATDSSGDPPRGLQVVKKLSYHLQTNKKGNRVTAFLALDHLLQIKAEPRKHGGKTILYIAVRHASAWSHMESNWEPLRHAVEQHPQKRVLIDCSGVRWSTVQSRSVRVLTSTLRRLERRAFAFVIPEDDQDAFKLGDLQSGNVRVFPCTRSGGLGLAEEWLVAQRVE